MSFITKVVTNWAREIRAMERREMDMLRPQPPRLDRAHFFTPTSPALARVVIHPIRRRKGRA